ncbi:MAG: hypothetical protein ACNA7J_15310, partial [Wenzhouxiangella sp.]
MARDLSASQPDHGDVEVFPQALGFGDSDAFLVGCLDAFNDQSLFSPLGDLGALASWRETTPPANRTTAMLKYSLKRLAS